MPAGLLAKQQRACVECDKHGVTEYSLRAHRILTILQMKYLSDEPWHFFLPMALLLGFK